MAKVTSKGQITIPKAVRERLGLKEQDRVLFAIDESGAHLVPVRQSSVSDLAGSMASDRPYPGLEAVREEVGMALGKAIEQIEQEEGDGCPNEPM